jgi:hypothetical protein
LRRVLRETGPNREAADLEAVMFDPVIADVLLPYLKLRCDGVYPPGIRADLFHATHAAVRLWSDRRREFHRLSFMLEAGVLAGRPMGKLLPESERVDGLVQQLYEEVFFAVREHLSDREWLLRAVFGSPWQATRAAGWGFRAKLFAYALGAVEYRAWISGRPSTRLRSLADLLERNLRYLAGLLDLGLARPDDPVNRFRRLFQTADRLRLEPDFNPGTADAIAAAPDWRERLAELERAIPSPARPPKPKKKAWRD